MEDNRSRGKARVEVIRNHSIEAQGFSASGVTASSRNVRGALLCENRARNRAGGEVIIKVMMYQVSGASGEMASSGNVSDALYGRQQEQGQGKGRSH